MKAVTLETDIILHILFLLSPSNNFVQSHSRLLLFINCSFLRMRIEIFLIKRSAVYIRVRAWYMYMVHVALAGARAGCLRLSC